MIISSKKIPKLARIFKLRFDDKYCPRFGQKEFLSSAC